MFCRGCGQQIHETAVACPHCGAIQQLGTRKEGTLWFPVPSLITGVICVLALFDESSAWDKETNLGLGIFATIAIVLGGLGIIKQARGRGMSISGVVFGVIGLLGLVDHLMK